MLLLVASDFHGRFASARELKELVIVKEPDLVVICGDLTNFGPYRLAEEILSEIAEAGVSTFFVPGNCDPPQLLRMVEVERAFCLHGTSRLFGDIRFIGVGGSNLTPFGTPTEFSEDELLQVLEKAYSEATRSERLALVTHAPPWGIKLDITKAGRHIGSTSIKDFIREKKPILALCGHVHESSGIDYLDGVPIVNPGPITRGYYALVNIDKKIDIKIETMIRSSGGWR